MLRGRGYAQFSIPRCAYFAKFPPFAQREKKGRDETVDSCIQALRHVHVFKISN